MKKFVQACQNCMKHISVHRDNILDFLPESAAPFLPKRSNSQFAFQINDERKVYCSAECFDHSFRNYIEVLSPFSESIKKPYEQYKAIEEQWSEFLPIVPLEMIFKAICLEILNLNPNLNSVADRSQLKDKNKLKCLSSYSHSQVSVDPMKELIISVTAVANKIFRPFCPFVITEHTIKDAISRLANNCIYFNLASPSPIEIYLASSVVRSKEDVEKINKIEDQLILNGNGNIKSIWHPTGFGLYENISILKRTDDYNASILYNETHQVELIACRTIERNEEITISTRINVQT